MAAYSTADSPRRMDSGMLSQRNQNESTGAEDGGAFWSYSATAAHTDVISTGWFSNADKLGMREGDWVFCSLYSSSGVGATGETTIGVLGIIASDGGSEIKPGLAIQSS